MEGIMTENRMDETLLEYKRAGHLIVQLIVDTRALCQCFRGSTTPQPPCPLPQLAGRRPYELLSTRMSWVIVLSVTLHWRSKLKTCNSCCCHDNGAPAQESRGREITK
ncbi:hypothetical protein INR49_009496 [Caranx melampygus]|nr:hypothetical protein INR49_009496 [Caranx melampygus]